MKHAFPDERSGAISVVLSKASALARVVEDNGVGCPRDKQERIGSRLTRLLAKQLDATLVCEDIGSGCRVHVQFSPKYPID